MNCELLTLMLGTRKMYIDKRPFKDLILVNELFPVLKIQYFNIFHWKICGKVEQIDLFKCEVCRY